jgi:hypothetical protein
MGMNVGDHQTTARIRIVWYNQHKPESGGIGYDQVFHQEIYKKSGRINEPLGQQ